MCAPFYYLTIAEDNDLITVPNRRQSVGDYDTGDSSVADGSDDFMLCLGVQGRCSLIQNTDGGVLRHGPGYFNTLTFSARKIPAAFQDLMIIAAVPLDNIVMDTGVSGRQDHLKILNGLVPHLNIVGDAVFKKSNILIYDRNRSGKYIPVNLINGHAVIRYGPAPGLV